MLERDLRLLKRLIEAGPGVPLYLDYPDFPSVLETIKLLGSDTSDENFREVWIPKEFYDVVAPHIDNVLREGEESGLFEMEQAALGYLCLYGIMTVDEFSTRCWTTGNSPADTVLSPSLTWCTKALLLNSAG